MAYKDRGADEARTIRVLAARLAEIDDLAGSSASREILLDLSYALANLAGPVGAVLDAWAAEHPEPVQVPDVDALTDLAGALRHAADNS